MKKLIKLFLICGIMLSCSIGVGVFNVNSFDVYASSIPVQEVVNVTATPPTSYDLRDDIYIQVEDQNPNGTCWAYASLTSLETYLALQYDEYYDFSELHLAIAGYKQDGKYNSVNSSLGDGGSFDNFFTYIQKDTALALECEYPTFTPQSISNSKPIYSTTSINQMLSTYNNIISRNYSLAKVNETISFPKFHGANKSSQSGITAMRNAVKQHIMQYGSVSAGISAGSTLKNYTEGEIYKVSSVSYNHPNNLIDHAISIIGWDDAKRAYLCLNSWGNSFGDNGAFYVSYDDYFIEYNIEGIVNATLSTQGSQINTYKQYPTNTRTEQFTVGGGTLILANIINVSSSIGESITSIDHFVEGSGTNFYIKFFDTQSNAISEINSINSNSVSTTFGSKGWNYNKYILSSPLEITNNYMVIISKTTDASNFATISRDNTYSSLGNTYMASSVTGFSTSSTLNSWLTSVGDISSTVHRILPTIIHTNKGYPNVSQFSSSINSYIDGTEYIQNNVIHQNKTVSFDINNCNIITSGITFKLIGSSTNKSTSLTCTVNSQTLNIKQNSTLTTGNYILAVPIDITNDNVADQTIYRMLEVRDNPYANINYNITYNLDGGSNDSSNPSTFNLSTPFTLKPASKTGYTFKGWYRDSSYSTPFNFYSLPASDITLYAKFETTNYTITYNLNDGTNGTNPSTYTIESDTITLQEATKLGYTFDGWYSNSNFTGNKITSIPQGSTGNKVLYAKFTAITYTINYHLYDGINDTNNPNNYKITDNITLLSPTKEGYKFIGWYGNSLFTGNKITTIQNSTGTLNLHAKFSRIYSITYMFNEDSITTSNPTEYTSEDIIELEEAEKNGYQFIAWYTEASLTNKIETISSSTGNLTLYASFTPINYTIDYEVYGGANDSDNLSIYTIESDTITLQEATKLGYTFDGWYSNSNFTGNKITIIPQGSTGNKVLYAKFTAITYTVNYHLLEGFINNNPTTYTIESNIITLQPATKDGYEFINWYNSYDEVVTTIPTGSTGNIDLYAEYDFALPTITTKTDDLQVTYTGSSYTIEIEASHALVSEHNTLSYQWYKYIEDSYTKIDCTTNALQLTDVADSGIYCCEVTITITDTTMTSDEVVKVLSPTETNNINVSISKKVHDMSKVRWNYASSLSYNATEQSVILLNLPEGVTAIYSNNKFTEINNYTASVTFEYDTDNTELSAHNISTLSWNIRKAKITIDINNIFNEDAYDNQTLQSLFSCEITSEYFPSNIVTQQQKIDYLEINYFVTETSLPSVKTISATTKEFEIYDITINDGEYRIVIKTLYSGEIYTTNEKGFATDCIFSAKHLQFEELSKTTQKLLNNTDLNYIDSVQVNYSYLTAKDNYSLFIPLAKEELYNPIKVYRVANNKLVEVTNISINENGLTIKSNLKGSVFIITHEPISNSNIGLIIAGCMVGLALVLSLIMIIRYKKSNDIFHRV